MITTLHFSEIEHNGDLDRAYDAIYINGGIIMSKQVNYEAETAEISVRHDQDNEVFKKKVYEAYWSNG